VGKFVNPVYLILQTARRDKAETELKCNKGITETIHNLDCIIRPF